MKYLCLIYQEEKAISALPRSEWNKLIENCMAFTDEMRASGYYQDGNALDSVNTATCLRVRNGKTSVTDGPFTETKEQLAGYCMLEARDLNDAIQIASQLPPLRYGCVEVRPVREPADELPALHIDRPSNLIDTNKLEK